MADIPSQTFFTYFLFLIIPFLIAFIIKKKKITPLIGYMIGGVVLGNVFSGWLKPDDVTSFAYLGILLLLFTIGLDLQIERMMSVKRFIILGGLLQLTGSLICGATVSYLFGFSLLQSALLGIALSSSSTTIVAKIIQDRGEESSFHGELAIGILMFQDIAFIPFVIIFSSLTTASVSFQTVGIKVIVDVLKSTILLGLVYILGRKFITPVFDKVARTSRELLNLFIITFIFFTAWVSALCGIPVLVSIFVAGMLIGQTSEHYHIFSQIRPLRDLLAIIFFVYIGTTLQIGAILPQIPLILIFTIVIMMLKALVVCIIFLFFRFSSRLSFTMALLLFQVDEDAFILLSLARANNLFTHQQYLFVISAVLLSLAITPLLIENKEKIYDTLRYWIKRVFPVFDSFLTLRIDSNTSPIDEMQLSDHVIICGFGRVGASIGRALMLSNIPFVGIDYNFYTVERAKRQGMSVIYGDPTDKDILDYAEIESAKVLVLAVPDRYSQETITLQARKLNKDLIIISRVHKHHDQNRMKDLGVDIVIQPEFEASMSIIKRIFRIHNLSKDDIVKKLQYFKLEQLG